MKKIYRVPTLKKLNSVANMTLQVKLSSTGDNAGQANGKAVS